MIHILFSIFHRQWTNVKLKVKYEHALSILHFMTANGEQIIKE